MHSQVPPSRRLSPSAETLGDPAEPLEGPHGRPRFLFRADGYDFLIIAKYVVLAGAE